MQSSKFTTARLGHIEQPRTFINFIFECLGLILLVYLPLNNVSMFVLKYEYWCRIAVLVVKDFGHGFKNLVSAYP